MELTRNEQSDLNNLCFHWDSAYEIAWNGEAFSAARLDGTGRVLISGTVWQLREMIRADYVRWHAPIIERSSL